MSLDVRLEIEQPLLRENSGIFIRLDGEILEVSKEEWNYLCPGHNPTIAEQIIVTKQVYGENITHNLGKMADAAGIYKHLWRPEEIGIERAKQLIEPLRAGLKQLISSPAKFKAFNPSNGWGSYEGLVNFVRSYLAACEAHPEAKVLADR